MGNKLVMDVSYRNTGYIVFRENTNEIITAGVFKTDAKELAKLYKLKTMQNLQGVMKVIKEVMKVVRDYNVTRICAELGSGSQSNTAAKALAFSYSFVAAPAIMFNIKPEIVTPSQVKKHVYKKTSGDKNGIINFFTNKFNIDVFAAKGISVKKMSESFDLGVFGNKRLTWMINGEKFTKGEVEHIADASVVHLITKKEN